MGKYKKLKIGTQPQTRGSLGPGFGSSSTDLATSHHLMSAPAQSPKCSVHVPLVFSEQEIVTCTKCTSPDYNGVFGEYAPTRIRYCVKHRAFHSVKKLSRECQQMERVLAEATGPAGAKPPQLFAKPKPRRQGKSKSEFIGSCAAVGTEP